ATPPVATTASWTAASGVEPNPLPPSISGGPAPRWRPAAEEQRTRAAGSGRPHPAPATSRSTEDWTSGREDPVVATVLPRRVHHPLHALRIRPGRQLAGGREHEARARARRVDAALHLGLDLSLGRPLEDRHVDIADRDHAPLVAERDQPVELIDLERGIALLIEVDRDRDEADVDQVLMDLVRRPANVN